MKYGSLEEIGGVAKEQAYLIDRGVRSCALIQLAFMYDELNYAWHYISVIMEEVESKNLKCIIKEYPYDNTYGKEYDVFIYKYDYQAIIIKEIDQFPIGSDIRNYLMGSLLGYSSESMEDFMMNAGRKTVAYYDNVSRSKIKEYRDNLLWLNVEHNI